MTAPPGPQQGVDAPGWLSPAAFAPPSGPPAAAHKRRSPWPSRIVLVLLALALAATGIAGFQPAGRAPASAAYALVGADGHRELLASPEAPRQVATLEWAHLAGATGVSAGPWQFMREPLPVEEAVKTFWIRTSTTTLLASSPERSRTEVLRAVTAAGVVTAVERDDRYTLAFDPMRVDLPSDIAAGHSWTSTGKLSITQAKEDGAVVPYTYKAQAKADPAGTGCLRVTGTFQFGTSSDHVRIQVWCPGRGIVADEQDGARLAATASFPPEVDPRVGLKVRAPGPPARVGDSWTLSAPKVDFPGATAPIVEGPPGFIGTSLLVHNAVGQGVTALSQRDGAIAIAWRTHPGGELTQLTGFGEIAVAATANRTLVAYDSQGQWLWQSGLPDVVTGPLLRLGDLVVAVSVDGTVGAYDLVSGAKAWEYSLPTQIEQPALIVGDGVVVLDASGTFVRLDAQGRVRWRTQAPDGTEGFAMNEQGGIAFGGSWIWGISAPSGSQLWRQRTLLRPNAWIAAGTLACLADSHQIQAFDLRTGAQQWTAPLGPDRLLTDGVAIVAWSSKQIVNLHSDGTLGTRWTTPATVGAIVGERGIVAITRAGEPVMIGP